MRKEMPLRHWATMPETQMIYESAAVVPARVATMIEQGKSTQPVSAAQFVPASVCWRLSANQPAPAGDVPSARRRPKPSLAKDLLMPA